MEQFIPLKENDPTKIYTLLQKISSGNTTNDLYKIKNKKTGEIFVAKIFKNNLNLYQKQLKSLIKFENPYLVQYYNTYIKKDKIWIITEYCDCGNVQDIMKITNKSYKESEIASIISMVLKGLQYLHLQKKYHGGIKLNNILINNEGVIKLSDYNISEQLLFNKDENVKNTPPELLGKNKLENYSVKSDIWYLGLTCIELAEWSPEIKKAKLIQEKKEQNGMKNSNLWSLEFIDFIQKCLNENPLNRPSAANLLNHPFIVNNNKGKIILKKKINSIKALIDIYREKIDEQEEKNNLYDLGKDNLEVPSFNDNLNKNDLFNDIEYKKNCASLNVNKSKYKHKSLLINKEYRMNQYKKIKKFKIGSKSIQIQNSIRKKNSAFTLSNKDSSNKKSTKTTIKKVINSNEIFAINEDLLRKKRHSLVNKYLKNSLKLHKQNNNEIQNMTKLNNTLDNIRPRNNLMKLLNTFERDKTGKNKSLNKSLRIKNIENIFNIFNNKENKANSIRFTNISKNTISNNKINDKSLSSIDSLRFSNADKKNKNLNSIDNNNIKLKTRNKKSNGGNPSLSDLNDNNKNLRKSNKKKNKILRNLLLREKQNETGYEKNIINLENNNGYKIINTNSNDNKVYNNEYIFKLNNSANIGNKYTKKREKNEFKFQDASIKSNKLNKTSKAPIVYYINQNEIKKIQKIPMSSNNKKNLIKKKKLKLINNPKSMSNNLYENSNTYNDSIQEIEKSSNIYNINNTDININLNNINNSNYYINSNTSKYYINNTFSYNNNNNNINNNILLSEEELRHLCLNDNINQRDLPQLITELAGLENKMYQEIRKIKELYEPIIIQHKDGIKFLKQNPFLKNIKEFKNFEIFKNKMKYNTNDDFENRNVSSSVHNLNKIKISFYRANDIEELNISANKYLFDKTGYYNNMTKI